MTDVGGRPTVYSLEVADLILGKIAEGMSVREICKADDMPARSTVMLWIAQDREGFSDRYARACEARAHYWADEILDIADDGHNDWIERLDADGEVIGWRENGEAVSRSRLRVDSRKWLLSKMLPKYSDRHEIKHTGSVDINQLSDDELNSKLLALINESSSS